MFDGLNVVPVRRKTSEKIIAHCRATTAPVILISGVSGVGKSRILREAAEQLEDRGVLVLPQRDAVRAGSPVIPGHPRRMLSVLNGRERVSRVDALNEIFAMLRTSRSAALPLVVVESAEFLDEQSLNLVDLLIRSERVGVVLTAAGRGTSLRFAEVLGSARGLSVELSLMSVSEVKELVTQEYGVPASEPLARYLHEVSGGVAAGVVGLLRAGFDERWLVKAGGLVVFNSVPVMLDSHIATLEMRRTHADLGPELCGLLYLLALQGDLALSEAVDASPNGEEIFRLEEYGAVEIVAGQVTFSNRALRYVVELSPDLWDATPERREELWRAFDPVTHQRRSVFAAWNAGIPCTDEELLSGARACLEAGLLVRAERLLEALRSIGPEAMLLRAEIAAVSGRPRSALAILQGVENREREALELGIYIHLAMFRDTSAVPALLERLYALGEGTPLERLRRDTLRMQVDWLSLPPKEFLLRHARSLDHGLPQGLEETADARLCWLHMLSAVANGRAVVGDFDGADGLLREIRSVHDWHVPLVAQGWLRSMNAAAVGCIGEDPSTLRVMSWFADVDERAVPDICSAGATDVFSALVRGVPDEVLRGTLRELHVQLHTGVPLGHAVRPAIEMLEVVLGVSDGQGLLGREADSLMGLSLGSLDPVLRPTLVLGQVLSAPADRIESALGQSAAVFEHVPGAHIAVLRSAVLRRAVELRPEILAHLADTLEEAGAESELMEVLRARLTGDAEALDAALCAFIDSGRSADGRAIAAMVREWGQSDFRAARLLSRTCPEAEDWLRSADEKPDAGFGPAELRSARLDKLTKRERDVALLAVEGASNAEAAERLGISRRTAETHLSNVYQKLGVRSRQELWAELSL